jgi:hypothetical protein
MTGDTRILIIPDPEYQRKTIRDLYEAGSFELEVLKEFISISMENLSDLERIEK